jgi:signal transduction histidine kinase
MAAPAKKLLNVGELCRHLTQLARTAVESSIRVSVELSPQTGWVRGNVQEIEQALLNLVLNAREAMPDGGQLLVSASNFDRETASQIEKFVRIVLADSGVGIAPEIRERIFHPGFTTKGGNGMGLAIASRVVRESGGEIRVRSAVGLGSSFEILLPRVEETVSANAAALPAAA